MANEFSDDTLLARWLAGTLSEEELRELRDRPDFADYEQLVKASDKLTVPPYDAAAELARLQERKAELKAAPQPAGRRTLRAVHYWSAAVAAALVLVLWVIWPSSAQEIYADAGTPISTSNLKDGSVLQLNASSSFKFSVADQRLGELSGEGFFEVQKSEVPFVVATELGTVTVLGTSFNVYAREGRFEVACVTGRVRVSFSGSDELIELTPQETALRQPDGSISKVATDKESTLDWLNGSSVFRSRPLREIIAELERQFNLVVAFPAGYDISARYSLSFSNTDLDLALAKVLDPLEGVTFKREGQTITVSNVPQ